MKRVTKEPWFGKKGDTIGLRPVSWHGWFFSFIFIVSLFGLIFMQYVNYEDVGFFVMGMLFIIIIFLSITVFSSDEKDRNKFN